MMAPTIERGSNMSWSFYREKAAQCHHLAEAASQPEIRRLYKTMERQWNGIAGMEDRYNHGLDEAKSAERKINSPKAVGDNR